MGPSDPQTPDHLMAIDMAPVGERIQRYNPDTGRD